MKLIIAEKPSLGRAIAEFLGVEQRSQTHIVCKDGYVVSWLFGHLLELYDAYEYNPDWKSWSAPLPIKPEQFKLKLKTNKGIKEQFNVIKEFAKQATSLINAADPDREGQLLVDELLEFINNSKPVERLWLAAIDDKSIAKAFAEIKSNQKFIGYKLAAETRQRADWLTGINYSRAFTLLFQKRGYDNMITIGRVQTPTLKLIADRDNEITNFKPKNFYELTAIFNNETPAVKARLVVPDSIKLLMDEDNRLLDRSPLDAIVSQIKGAEAIVTNYTKQAKTKKQPLLFNLSELQTVANKKYGYSAQLVLDVAQALYENKLTSYPRSDCQYMPNSQLSDAKSILLSLSKLANYTNLNPNPNIKSLVWNDSKVTAHHAIIPTGANLSELEGILVRLGDKQTAAKNIFDLICLQYIAQFYPEMQYNEVEIIFKVKEYQFKAIGKTTTNLGWTVLFNQKDEEPAEDDESQSLPVLIVGQPTTCVDPVVISKQTQKPKPYTEGTVIKTMANIHNKIPELVKQLGKSPEETTKLITSYRAILKETAGLGTEATRANILETLKLRQLIKVEGKNLVSTDLGRVVVSSIANNTKQLSFLSSPLTTASYEQILDEIAIAGDPAMITKFWNQFNPQLDILNDLANLNLNLEVNSQATTCPKCAENNATNPVKLLDGKFGKYWKCFTCNSNFPNDKNKPLYNPQNQGTKLAAVSTGEECPECKSPIVEREGKFGKFKSCSGYPKCKWTPPKIKANTLQAEAATGDEVEPCPRCGASLVDRVAKASGNKFKACSAFPKCNYIK